MNKFMSKYFRCMFATYSKMRNSCKIMSRLYAQFHSGGIYIYLQASRNLVLVCNIRLQVVLYAYSFKN